MIKQATDWNEQYWVILDDIRSIHNNKWQIDLLKILYNVNVMVNELSKLEATEQHRTTRRITEMVDSINESISFLENNILLGALS